MFGINGAEFLVIAVIAVVVIGPERLPRYAEQLGSWVRSLRGLTETARDRVAEEMGTDAVDWQALDPRRYDPRRIVRDALLEPPTRPGPRVAARATPADPGTDPGTADAPAPFDDEAT